MLFGIEGVAYGLWSLDIEERATIETTGMLSEWKVLLTTMQMKRYPPAGEIHVSVVLLLTKDNFLRTRMPKTQTLHERDPDYKR